MFARVSRFEGSPEGMDEALRHVREQVLPQLHARTEARGLSPWVTARAARYWV